MTVSSGGRDAAYPQHYELVSFWTPDGWLRGPSPLDGNPGLDRNLEMQIQACPDADQQGPRVEVWQAGIGLCVKVYGYHGAVADFWVGREHEAAFAVERLPALIQAFGGIRRGEDQP